jgi:SAM-dependent methyltransferase
VTPGIEASDFTARITPRSPELVAAARRVFAERQDLQKAYGDVDTPGFRRWLAANGPLEYPALFAHFYPPIPPQELRDTACGGRTEHSHLWTGVEDLENLLGLWEVFGPKPLDQVESVLDFGCACGRVLRWMPLALPGARLFGVDVRAASIEWCRAHLQGDFRANATQPPLAHIADGSIDLVYALSVFSHLNLASSRAWLAELARVCRPQGRILVTVCGGFFLWVLTRSREHQERIRIDAELARAYLRRLHPEGFVFHGLPSERLRLLDGVEDDYGQTFLSEAFAAAWSPAVDLVAYVPASLSLLQDFAVFAPAKSRGRA